MELIQMKTPLVEMDGDEMTRVIWKMIKDNLLCPYIDLKTEYYDLGLETAIKPTTALPSNRPKPQKIRCCSKMRHYNSKRAACRGILA